MKFNLSSMPDKIFGIDTNMIGILFPLGVVILMAVIGFNLIVVPKFSDYTEMNKSLSSLKGQNESLLEKVRYISSINPEELKKNSEFISSALLPQRNSYLLVDVVQKIVVKYGFQVDSFSINPGKIDSSTTTTVTTKSNLVNKIPIRVSIIGPKAGYLDLLKGFEKSLPVLSLNSFKMLTQDTLVKLDLDIEAFYLKGDSKVDIEKLSLADLTLAKDEKELLSTLNQFTVTEDLKDIDAQIGGKSDYVKYERLDPFSL